MAFSGWAPRMPDSGHEDQMSLRPVSTALAIEVCRTIEGIDLDILATPGTVLYNEATGKVIYTCRWL